MTINNSSELRTALDNWLDRSDLSGRRDEFIQLTEATFNKVIRDARMIVSTTLTVSSGAINSSTFPTNLLDIAYVQVQGSATQPLKKVSFDEMGFLHKHRFASNGTPAFYSVVGRRLRVGPAPTAGTTLVVDYYRSLPSLVSSTANWLLTYDPDLYLYGTLMHAAPYLEDEKKRAIMENVMVKSIQIALARHEKLTMEQVRQPVQTIESSQ